MGDVHGFDFRDSGSESFSPLPFSSSAQHSRPRSQGSCQVLNVDHALPSGSGAQTETVPPGGENWLVPGAPLHQNALMCAQTLAPDSAKTPWSASVPQQI